MKHEKILLLAVLLFCISARALSSFPLNDYLPGGTDASSHLFKVWYIVEKGLTKWNFYWYGGFPFLKFYAPLSYLVAGYLGKFFGYLIAYKLVVDLAYIATPIVFYFFLREFKLSTEKIIIALLTFSLIPIYSYYLFDGRHPTLIAMNFALLYWLFLKKSLDSKKLRYILLSSIFLALTGLTHHLIIFLVAGLSLVWTVFYRFGINSMKMFFTVSIIGFLLVSWWFAPFLLEKGFEAKGQPIIGTQTPIEFGKQILLTSYASDFYSFSFSPYLIITSFAVVLLISAFSIFRINDRNVRSFFFTAVFIVLMIFMISYRRILIFLPIPISILVAEGFDFLKTKKIIGIILAVVLILAYFSLSSQIYQYPDVPEVPKDGRVMYLPVGSAFVENEGENKNFYEALLAPINGNEYALGWYPESQSKAKSNYNDLLSNPLMMKTEDYYKLLKDGWVNYLVVKKSDQKTIDFLSSSVNFKKMRETDKFIVFELEPKSSYIEFNGNYADVKVNKNKDSVSIETFCEKGIIKIKESYDKGWSATINKKSFGIEENSNGFMEIKSDVNGQCAIELTYFSIT